MFQTVIEGRRTPHRTPPRFVAVALMGCAAVTLLTAAGPRKPATEWLARSSEAARMERVEMGLEPAPLPSGEALRLSLSQWMELYKIPGLSIAVFEKNSLVWAKSYGVKQAGGSDLVTLDTLFQAASISKPVTALAVAHHAEKGRWSLDEDVNGKLLSWKVPDNEHTKEQKVTLRRLLSHSAGTPFHAIEGYPAGAPMPTLQQILDGAPPANSPPVRVEAVPGTVTRYSSSGMVVVQQLMVDQLGKPFPQIMREAVLAPLGMKHSTFEQPLPAALAPMAATGTRPDGSSIEGRWHTYPEMAAAGLWTTPSDLARLAIEVAKAQAGTSKRVVSQAMAKQLLTQHELSPPVAKQESAWKPEAFGLGFRLPQGQGSFGHGGWSEGFRSQLLAFADSGSGVVMMSNSDNATFLLARLANSVAAEYGWKAYRPRPTSPYVTADLLVRLKGVDVALAWFKAQHAAGKAEHQSSESLNGLGYDLMQGGKVADAVKVFEANVALFPQDANAHDSLGEGYVKAGRKAEAITRFKKALVLDPKNDHAAKMLEKLGAHP